MYKIDNDIPLPSTGWRAPEDSKTGTLRKLEVGQSVFFPGVKNMTGFIRNIQLDEEYKLRKYITRTVEEADPTWQPPVIEAGAVPPKEAEEVKAPKVRGVRVWRVEDAPAT